MTETPRLRDDLLALQNNVYGEVAGTGDTEEVASAFERLGWSTRRCADREYEIEHTWASFVVVPTAPLTYSGVVDPARAQDLLDAFRTAGYLATAELQASLIWSDTITDQAGRIHQQVRSGLTAANIPGELVWTGASSLPNLLTKGDVDLHLRVPAGTFDEVVTALDSFYPRASLHSWAPTLAVFDIPGRGLSTGLAVTPIGSEHDHRFTHTWHLLANDPALRAQYNALKQNAGDPETYEAEKSAFFSRLTST